MKNIEVMFYEARSRLHRLGFDRLATPLSNIISIHLFRNVELEKLRTNVRNEILSVKEISDNKYDVIMIYDLVKLRGLLAKSAKENPVFHVTVDGKVTNLVAIVKAELHDPFPFVTANLIRPGDNVTGFLDTLSTLFREPLPDVDDIDFVTYSDLGTSSESTVVLAYKTPEGWFGGSHRVSHHFTVGEVIDLNEAPILLSHGYVRSSGFYDTEEEHINEIKSYADENNKIVIKDFGMAKNLAIRLAEATG